MGNWFVLENLQNNEVKDMIYDEIINAGQYRGVHPGIDRVLEEMQKFTPDNYPKERISLDGDNLFLLFGNYETHSPEGALTEAHQQYIDVMYMVEGAETIYVKPVSRMQKVTKPYDASIEALLGETDADATPVRLEAGCFIVLFPQDAHAPACYAEGPVAVKKIIGKVRI